jgi:hypothetical protein
MYAESINNWRRGLFVLLIDQSEAMGQDALDARGDRKTAAALMANALIQNVTIFATRAEGVIGVADLAVFGYRSGAFGEPLVESLLEACPDGTGIWNIRELADHPRQIEQTTARFFDEDNGQEMVVPVERPVWVTPQSFGSAPLCSVLQRAHDLVKGWIQTHPDSFPPAVVLFTSGENSESASPLYHAELLKSLATCDGNVLLLVQHLAPLGAQPSLFPHRYEQVDGEVGRLLFLMASVIPERMFDELRRETFDVQAGARALGVGSEVGHLLKVLPWGSGGPATDKAESA